LYLDELMEIDTATQLPRDSIQQWLLDTRCLWNYHVVFDDIERVDAIVCLGSYDVRVAERCARLMLDGAAQMAVITGGFGNWTRETFDRPEAEIFADVIAQRGIAKSKLIIERHATNIGENVELSRRALLPHNVQRVAFVTKPQTQRRVSGTVRAKWPEIDAKITAPLLGLFDQARDEQGMVNLTDEMVGDLQRIIEYPKSGFQIEMNVPAPVLDAYARLRALGFDRHCLPTR
jgi:DUF218 domain